MLGISYYLACLLPCLLVVVATHFLALFSAVK